MTRGIGCGLLPLSGGCWFPGVLVGADTGSRSPTLEEDHQGRFWIPLLLLRDSCSTRAWTSAALRTWAGYLRKRAAACKSSTGQPANSQTAITTGAVFSSSIAAEGS